MFDNQAKLIEKRLGDNWLATPIAWDGVEYIPSPGKPWIRIQVSWADSTLISGTSDGGVYRETGIITIGVFTANKTGTRSNQDFCSSIANIFRGWSEGSLFCQAPYVVRVGEENEWFYQNVIIPFFYDNCFVQEVV